jgi:hypothetical protein
MLRSAQTSITHTAGKAKKSGCNFDYRHTDWQYVRIN